MKMFFKKSIAIIICICMFFCAVPMSGFFDYNFSGLFNTTANALAVPPGYEFGGYDDDGNPIYVAGKVQYAVDIYMMNINGEYGEPVQKIFYDYADAVVTYVPEIPVGYFLNSEKSVLEATVLADGATVLRVYLDRMINCNLIYGFFHAWLTEDEVIDYLKDEYGGYIEAGYNEYEPYAGTGAYFYRYDSIDAEESTGTYWVVIFGDVNGDSQINSADVKAIEDELAGATIWSVKYYSDSDIENPEYFPPKIMAADLNKDGKIDYTDLERLENVVLGAASINQKTGEYILGDPEIPDGTFCGKLESSEMINDIDDGGSWVYKMVIDGIEYDVKENLISESLEDVEGQDVVFTVENGVAVWFSTVWDLVQKINCNLVVNDQITYSGKEYSADEIQARIDVKYSYKGKNVAELKAISELGVAVSGVKLKSSNPDLLNFDGKAETMVLFNDIVPIGGSASKAVTINVDSSYEISDLTEKEVVSITCDMSAAGDGKLIEKAPRVKNITVANWNYEKPVIEEPEEPDEPDEPDKVDSSQFAQNAGNILKKFFQGAAAGMGLDSYLYEILTVEQLQAIGNILICEASMASAEKGSFSEGTISDALFEKVFNFKKSIYVTQREISVTVVVESPKIDGDLKIKFTCVAEDFRFLDSSSTIHGNINYEIIGGKGKKHIPKDKKDGDAGALYVANVKSFCEAAWALAEAELKNAYNIAWGDDVNSAVDLIFGKCVNKILKAANLDSVAGLTWKLITIPAASVKIECPVDVYVYNSNDELVAAVEDNEVILTNDKAQITVNGDTKYVTLFDESYYIVYEATADGTMRVTVNEHANSEDIVRTVVIDEIPLESGAVFSQNIDCQILEESNYSITGDDQTVYTPDSDETTFHYHETDGEWFVGKTVECTEDGWNYTQCNICGKWYKEIILCEGHKDKDANGYCDDCKTLIWQTITWIVDGEEITTICKEGAGITRPEIMPKTGYMFSGWTPEVPDSMPAEDLTFTAAWKANSYDAVFDATGGKWADGKETKTVPTDFDTEIKEPEAPEKPGYIFSKWSPEVGIMDSVDGKKFVAEWVAATDTRYTVETYTMNTSGEHEKSVQTLNGTTDSTVKAEYTVETGFALNSEKSVLSGTVTADNSLVLKVYIDRNTYTFTTVVDGVSTETKYLYGSMVSEPATPTKEEYKFIKWNGTIPETMPAENVTITAVLEKCYLCPECGNEILGEDAISKHIASETKVTISDGVVVTSGELKPGATIAVSAPQVDGKIFSHWTVEGATVAETESAETTIVLGGGKISITAEYDDCDCKCHQGGIAGFFFKIVLFFQKLFGNNLECFCGKNH